MSKNLYKEYLENMKPQTEKEDILKNSNEIKEETSEKLEDTIDDLKVFDENEFEEDNNEEIREMTKEEIQKEIDEVV